MWKSQLRDTGLEYFGEEPPGPALRYYRGWGYTTHAVCATAAQYNGDGVASSARVVRRESQRVCVNLLHICMLSMASSHPIEKTLVVRLPLIQCTQSSEESGTCSNRRPNEGGQKAFCPPSIVALMSSLLIGHPHSDSQCGVSYDLGSWCCTFPGISAHRITRTTSSAKPAMGGVHPVQPNALHA